MSVGGYTVSAHRVAWMLVKGASPPSGKVIDHVCQNRGCVNFRHMEAVTVQVNTLRGNGPTAERARARKARAA